MPDISADDSSHPAPTMQFPDMQFDNSPNARSTKIKEVQGAHTYGRPNEIPTEAGTYTIGVSEDVGARRTMEDAYSFVVDFAGIQGQGFFAVFDGHAGKHAAEWCGQHFHEELLKQLVMSPEKAVPEVIASTFSTVDTELTRVSETGATNSGCTAVTAFLRLEDEDGSQLFAPKLRTLVTLPNYVTSQISNSGSRSPTPGPGFGPAPVLASSSKKLRDKLLGVGTSSSPVKKEDSDTTPAHSSPAFTPPKDQKLRRVLYTANAGDARAVLARHGTGVRLTYDHKGNDKQEVRRIQEAGGFVLNNRVNGVLAVTRSLGDSAMKEFVVGSPYTSEIELRDSDKFLIVACDGLWDVVDDQKAVTLIMECQTAKEASDILVKYALDNFSHDNVTVLVVKFATSKGGADQSAISTS